MASAASIPSPKELDNLSKEICDCWQSLGLQLGVELARIDSIRHDNVQYPSVDRKAFAMLNAWFDKGAGSTYATLSDALRCVDKARLAEKYCENDSVSQDESGLGKVVSTTLTTQRSHASIELGSPGGEVKIPDRYKICQEPFHGGAELEHFCTTCQRCICHKCTLVAHHEHAILSLTEVAGKARARLQEEQTKLRQRGDAWKEQINKDNETRRKNKERMKEVREAIQESSRKFVELVKQHEQEMLMQIDAFEADEDEKFKDQAKQSKVGLEMLDTIIDHLRSVQEGGDLDVLWVEKSASRTSKEMLTALNYRPLRTVYVGYKPDEELSCLLKKRPLGEAHVSSIDPSKTEIQGLKVSQIANNRCAKFSVVTKDSEDNICYSASEKVAVEILSPAGEVVRAEVEDRKDGIYTVSFTPNTEGVHHVTVRVREQSPTNCNRDVHVITLRRPRDFMAIAEFGLRGSGEGQFKFPCGIAVSSDGEVAVSDRDNHRVQIFSADCQFLRMFGEEGTGDGQLRFPLGLAYMNSGHIVVADQHNSRIQKFTPAGLWVSKFGQDVLETPWSVSVTSHDNIVVCDYDEKTVNVFSSSGELFLQFSPGDNWLFCAIACNDEYIFVSSDVIKVFDFNGTHVYDIATMKQDGQNTWLHGLSHSTPDLLFVCDGCNDRVQVFTLDGQLLTAFGSTGLKPEQFNFPYCIAVSPGGLVFVTDCYNNRVQVFKALY